MIFRSHNTLLFLWLPSVAYSSKQACIIGSGTIVKCLRKYISKKGGLDYKW
jgi:hypothetical protein